MYYVVYLTKKFLRPVIHIPHALELPVPDSVTEAIVDLADLEFHITSILIKIRPKNISEFLGRKCGQPFEA